VNPVYSPGKRIARVKGAAPCSPLTDEAPSCSTSKRRGRLSARDGDAIASVPDYPISRRDFLISFVRPFSVRRAFFRRRTQFAGEFIKFAPTSRLIWHDRLIGSLDKLSPSALPAFPSSALLKSEDRCSSLGKLENRSRVFRDAFQRATHSANVRLGRKMNMFSIVLRKIAANCTLRCSRDRS